MKLNKFYVVLILLLMCVSCIRTPLDNIKNAVVIKKDRSFFNAVEVIQYNYIEVANENRYFITTYHLCDYEFDKVEVGDSINYKLK